MSTTLIMAGTTTLPPLRERPLLGPRHLQYFTDLDVQQVTRIWSRLQEERYIRKGAYLPALTGEALFEACRRAGLDHCAVVFAMGREFDGIGRPALEKLIGHPIVTWRPPPRVAQPPRVPGEAPPRPAGAAPTADMVVLSVKPNPKKPGSATHERYKHWVVGRTLNECLAAGIAKADVPWDTDASRKFVVLGTRKQYEDQKAADEAPI